MEQAYGFIRFLEAEAKTLGKQSSEEVLTCLKDLLTSNHQNDWMSMSLLCSTLKFCDLEVYEEHALLWFKFTLKLLNSIPSESLVGLCLENLNGIVTKSVLAEKISREFSTKGLEPLLQLLTGPSLPPHVNTLHLLTTCMKLYPGTCGRQRKKIENLLLSFIPSIDNQISITASHAFSLLPQIGSGGEKHFKHKENWQEYVTKLLKSICVFSTDLMNANNENQTNKMDEIFVLPFPKYEGSVINSGLLCLLRIEKLLQMLNGLLKRSTSFVVHIPLSIIVHTFCEVINLLDIDFEKRSDLQIEKSTVSITLDGLLSNLMTCFGTCCKQFSLCFAPYTDLISKSILRVLSHPGFKYKSQCYETFQHCIRHCFLSFTNCTSFADILDCVLNDTKLEMNNAPKLKQETQHTKKKKKNQQAKAFSRDIDQISSNNQQIGASTCSIKNTESAYRTLSMVVTEAGHTLSSDMMQKIISELLIIHSKLSENPFHQIGQYTDKIKLNYLETLSSLLHLHHNMVQIPTSIILSIFRMNAFIGSQCSEIKSYCQHVLLNFDQVLHSATPELRGTPKMVSFGNIDDNNNNGKAMDIDEQSLQNKQTKTMDSLTQSSQTDLPPQNNMTKFNTSAKSCQTPPANGPISINADVNIHPEPIHPSSRIPLLTSPRRRNSGSTTPTTPNGHTKELPQSRRTPTRQPSASPRRSNTQGVTPTRTTENRQQNVSSPQQHQSLRSPRRKNTILTSDIYDHQRQAVHISDTANHILSESPSLSVNGNTHQQPPINDVVVLDSSDEENEPASKRSKVASKTVDVDEEFENIISTFCEE